MTQAAQDEIEVFVHRIMEKYKISPADMKVILGDIAENVNPYVSVGELKAQPFSNLDIFGLAFDLIDQGKVVEGYTLVLLQQIRDGKNEKHGSSS